MSPAQVTAGRPAPVALCRKMGEKADDGQPVLLVASQSCWLHTYYLFIDEGYPVNELPQDILSLSVKII